MSSQSGRGKHKTLTPHQPSIKKKKKRKKAYTGTQTAGKYNYIMTSDP